MRTEHSLWRVSNGWLLVPEDTYSSLSRSDAPRAAVFKTLKEFSDQYPKRERKRRTKPTAKETNNANIN